MCPDRSNFSVRMTFALRPVPDPEFAADVRAATALHGEPFEPRWVTAVT